MVSKNSKEPGASGANQESPGSFQSLGEATDAVVMRLRSKLPRIRVKRVRSVVDAGGRRTTDRD
jgi:hypothetical protein